MLKLKTLQQREDILDLLNLSLTKIEFQLTPDGQ